MHTNIIKNTTAINRGKYLYLLLFILIFSQNSTAQENFKGLNISNNKPTHSFGISYKNNVFLPEKVWDEKGLIKRNPKYRYAFEVMLNYNLIFKQKWGVKMNLFLAGTIPTGFDFRNKTLIPDTTKFTNGLKGNILEDFFSIGGGGLAPYWGADFLVNYTLKINNRIFLQPELGVKLILIPSLRIEHYLYYLNPSIYEEYIDNDNTPKVFPDLIANFNFLFHAPKAPKHNFLLGLSFNYGFVQRLEGNYKFINLGKYNTTGKVSFGSTHFGINLGYQFIGLRKSTEKSTDTILFNPRF